MAMAVKREQQEEGPPMRPQFFTVLLPGFSHRLKIPQQFNKYIVPEIQRKATLVCPLGNPWDVQVHRGADFFYFGEGWQEFSEAHCLNVGCFLVFKYEGGMVFSVTVFDQSACMKEYSPAKVSNEMDNKYSSSHVRMKPSESPGQHEVLDEQPLAEMTSSMDCQGETNLGRTCTEGPQFVININSRNPCGEPNLLLPLQFTKCLSQENSTLATIFSPTGKAWHIKVHEDSEGFHFADGWQGFAEAHNLRRGDSLVFKHNGGLLFDIKIFDNSISESKCNLDLASGVANARIPAEEEDSEKGLEKLPMHLPGKRVAKALEPTPAQDGSVKMEEILAQDWDGEAPDLVNGSDRILHFGVVINLSSRYRQHAFEIPAKFARSNGLSSTNQLFFRDPDGQLWPVRLSHSRGRHRGRSTAYAGWRDFCVGNNLKDGDVCLFQLKGKDELHVTIDRGRHQRSMKVSWDTSRKTKRSLCQQSTAELVKSKVNHDARLFTSNVSQCDHRRGQLNVPRSFLSSVDLSSVRQITLLDAKARPWPVNLRHWKLKKKDEARMISGWREFCNSNNVEVGDKCIFKLASRVKNDVFHVTVIKKKAMARTQMSGN